MLGARRRGSGDLVGWKVLSARRLVDPVGHYHRRDVFGLAVDTAPGPIRLVRRESLLVDVRLVELHDLRLIHAPNAWPARPTIAGIAPESCVRNRRLDGDLTGVTDGECCAASTPMGRSVRLPRRARETRGSPRSRPNCGSESRSTTRV